MNKPAAPSTDQQEQVNTYFQSQASFWKDIYATDNLTARIYQQRQEAALAWIDTLALSRGAQVLEVGCGAGFLSIQLAQRGLQVHAIDSAEAMLHQAREHAEAAGVTLSLSAGDVSALAFDDDSFDLVVALGVIPWLAHPERAVREMARVTKPGGHLIISADNRARLNSLLDPLLNPLLVPLKKGAKHVLDRARLRHLSSKDVGATLHSRRFIDQVVRRAGLTMVSHKTLGFGPFTFFRMKLVPESLGAHLHLRLQSLADREMFIFRSTGVHYLVLTEKPARLPTALEGVPGSDAVTA